MNLTMLNDDEKLFFRRLSDIYEISQKKGINTFTKFLNERQQSIAKSFITANKIDGAVFWGGLGEENTRKVLGFFPYEEDYNQFPIKPITVRVKSDDKLNHRDFLGSLTALGINRDSIGDILIEGDFAPIFLLSGIYKFVLENLMTIGASRVIIDEGLPQQFNFEQKFAELKGTVSSLRLDSVVKLITNYSREKAAKLINAEKVQLNYVLSSKISQICSAGDVVTIRGFGKFKLDSIGSPTKKGRLPLLVHKYI